MNSLSPNSPYVGRNMYTNANEEEEHSIEVVSIVPGESIGDLKIGMAREDILKILKKDMHPLTDSVEFYKDVGIKVEYENNRAQLIETDGFWPLFLDETDLFNSPFSDCVKLIQKKDPKAISRDGICQSDLLGIGIMSNKPDDRPPYLVAIFTPQRE